MAGLGFLSDFLHSKASDSSDFLLREALVGNWTVSFHSFIQQMFTGLPRAFMSWYYSKMPILPAALLGLG